MKTKNSALGLRSAILLLLAALIWGIAFVAQSEGMKYVGPFTFNGVRSIIGAAVLLPVIAVSDAKKKREGTYKKPEKKEKKFLMIGGVVCGVILCIATNFQQFALVEADAGKAGFITALYIVIVPLLGIFLKKRVRPLVWICVLIALVGMYLLCMTSTSFTLSLSDWLLILCAIVFSLHILAIDRFSPHVDGVRLSCIQFLVCGVITCILMFVFERPTLGALLDAYIPILYAGIFSCGVAYTLQIVGQKGINPTVASLLLSMESVFSALAGWVILGQTLSLRELGGCAMIFVAIILAQLPEKKKA